MADEVRMENVAIYCAPLVCVHFIGFLSAKAGSCVVEFGQGEPKGLSSARPEAYDNSALPFKSCISVGLGSIFSENSLCVPLISICAHIFAEVGSMFSLVSLLAQLQLAPLRSVLGKSRCFQGQHSVDESLW